MLEINNEDPTEDFMVAIENFERDIASFNKKAWNRSYCELHYQFKEFIVWIEVSSIDKVLKCPRILLSLYNKYVDNINIINK